MPGTQGAVLVVGGAGYIGAHVVRQLTESNARAVVLDDLSAGSPLALIHGETLVRGSVHDTPLVASVLREHGCRTVMHFAASVVAPESVVKPLEYYANNAGGMLSLLQACTAAGVSNIVFSSTAAVYGQPERGIATEDSPTAPINPYGASKLMCERMLADAAMAHDLRYVILRYFNVAGADPAGRMGQRAKEATHLIRVCCQAALGRREGVDIFGSDYPTEDGTGVRDYVHVEDLAAAHLAALRYLHRDGASCVLNVGYGRGHTVRQVIEAAKRVSGIDFPVRHQPRRPGDPAALIASAGRIGKVLNWTPTRDNLDGIVRDALNWERKLNAGSEA